MVYMTKDVVFWNYAFPLVSISAAGIYDSYGRYEKGADSSVKLCTRTILDSTGIFFALYYTNVERSWKHYIAACILLVSGGIVLHEAISRIKTAIEISSWYARFR